MSWLLLGAAAIFAVLHIHSDYRGRLGLTYVFKPLTMVAIIAMVWVPGPPADGYPRAIVAALLLSLVGDVFLMLRPARFLAGLSSFLAAHLVYVGAFASRMGAISIPATIAAVAAGGAMLLVLWPGLGRLRGPVALYVAAVSAMVVTAISAAIGGGPGPTAAAAGAVLFMASDACLGYARFRRRFAAAQGLILGSYYPAQALIALSAGALYG